MGSSIIRGKYVVSKVTGPESSEVLSEGAIYQEDGRIIELGSFSQLREKRPDVKVIGSSNHLVMPGLVNGHDHIGISGVQLGIPYMPLELSGLTRIGVRDIDPYLDHLLGAIQMLESGTTTVQIMYTPGRGAAPVDEVSTAKVVQAYKDAGVRLCYAPILQDQNSLVASPKGNEQEFNNSLPGDLKELFAGFMSKDYWPADELVGAAEDVINKYNGSNNGRTVVNTAPTNVQRCSDDLLMGLKSLSVKYKTTSHVHLLETVYQRLFGNRIYGTSATKHLEDIGFLGPDVVCGHSIWVTEGDVDIIQRAGASVCHNPSSNFRVFSGIAPVPVFLEKGIRVAIGTDNMAMNDDKDMFQDMRLVLKIHRLPGVEFNPITPHQVLEMATINGALSTGFGDSIGVLEPGKRADVLLLDLERMEQPYLNPDVSIVDALVHRARDVDVDTVIVDGELVMEARKLTKVDKKAVYKEIYEALDRPLSAQEDERRLLAKKLLPYLKAFYSGTTRDLSRPFSQYNAR